MSDCYKFDHAAKRRQPYLALKDGSEKVQNLIGYWTPPILSWEPVKKTVNSSLRIACVVEDSLYQGLRFEGEVLLLTPVNWEYVLRYCRPDVFLMESVWKSATEHWHMGQCPGAPDRDELLKMVSLASKMSIPTVFWITKGYEYHEQYKEFAGHFDYVFCADLREVDLLRTDGLRAEALLPCVQPALYNPFRFYDQYDAFSLDVLYDGWADLERMTDELRLLKEVKPYGLSIIESRYQIFRRRIEFLPEYKDCILGCVSERSRIQALKYAKAYVTHEKTLSTRTTQQWMTLEAVSSRLPVVYYGRLSDDDVCKGLVIECSVPTEFQVEFVRFSEDELYRERVAHLGWRKVNQQHTFSHRIQTMCKTIGIEHDWEEYPKASLITPTFRRDFLPRCLETFQRQTYPNKELILVYNGREVPTYEELGLESPVNEVKIANVPGEMFAGACLNQGHILAEGEYFFRVDDDDYYGPNYVMDMILNARSIDADFFGKPMSLYYYFPEEDFIALKKTRTKPYMILTSYHVNAGRRFSGNSFSGKISLFAQNTYPDLAHSAADSIFLYDSNLEDLVIASMDNLNLIAERRKQQSTHTWKMDEDIFRKTLKYVSDTRADAII